MPTEPPKDEREWKTWVERHIKLLFTDMLRVQKRLPTSAWLLSIGLAFTGEDPYGGSPGGTDGEPGPDGTNGGQLILGKTDASHSKGATGTISIYDASDDSDTGNNLADVKNYFADLDSGKWVVVASINGTNILIAGEC